MDGPEARLSVSVINNDTAGDPLSIRAQLAMKVALNAHSTAVMSLLGKVLGNCMVNVSPSNLKLIGRATNLILMHVNPAAKEANLPPVSYALANAVLYDSIALLKEEAAKISSGQGQAGGASAAAASRPATRGPR